MKKVTAFIFHFSYYIILSLSGLIFLYLSSQIFFTHTYIPMRVSEKVEFFANSWEFYLLLPLFIILCLLLRPILKKMTENQLFIAGTIFYLLAGSILLTNVTGTIRADAKHVFDAAQAFNQGDYSSLTTVGAYLYRNPHQLGLMSWESIYFLIEPTTHFAFFVNLILILLTNFLIYKITALLLRKPLVSKYTILFTFLFFPQFFFILFIYGTIPGLCCSLLSLYAFIRFEQSDQNQFLFLGAVSIGIACLLRNNYIIFALMLIGIQLLSLIRKWSWKKLLAPVLIVFSIIAFNQATNFYYARLIGYPIGEGTPKIAYITMGLRDDPKRESLGGWYDGYNKKILKRNHYNEKAAHTMAAEDLKQLLFNFLQKPSYAFKFFSEKIRSTWTEPTFQSIWTGPQTERGQFINTRLLQSIYQEGTGYRFLNLAGLVFLAFIYLFSTAFLIYRLFRPNFRLISYERYPFIFFIGGFIFHIFWETKSQYVYPYVLLLLPIAAQSLVGLSDSIQKQIISIKRKTGKTLD